MANDDPHNDSLLDSLRRFTGQVAGGTFELARTTATMTAMFGETWLRSTVLNNLEPERVEAMREAGNILRDARETAGLSVRELAESLGLKDKQVLEDVEHGQAIMPLEVVLRSASLLARHDPIPFLIKFMRTYNPGLEKTLEQLGVMALPRQYERERRFINLYRQHDQLRQFSDAEFERYIDYMAHSSELVVTMMQREKDANTGAADSRARSAASEDEGEKPEKKAPAKPAPGKKTNRAKTKAKAGTGSTSTRSRAAKPKKPATSTASKS